MSYTAWSVVFGEQPSAAKWNILGTNDASFNDGTGIGNQAIFPNHVTSGGSSSTWAWQSWTPTWTSLTVGNGTVTAAYIQVGKTVFYRVKFVFGSTSTIGNDPSCTPPVAFSNTIYNRITTPFGVSMFFDTSVGVYYNGYSGKSVSNSGNNLQPYTLNAAGTYSVISGYTATVPVAYGTGDEITFQGFYEAA